MPTIKTISFETFKTEYDASIIAKNITLSKDGTVYFIAERSY